MFSQILPQKGSDSAGHCPTISKTIIQISGRKLIREMMKGVNLENCASSGKLLATLLSNFCSGHLLDQFWDILRIVTFSGGEKGQPEIRLSSQKLSKVAKSFPEDAQFSKFTPFTISWINFLPDIWIITLLIVGQCPAESLPFCGKIWENTSLCVLFS